MLPAAVSRIEEGRVLSYRPNAVLLMLAIAALASCAGREVLEPLPAANPDRIDLAGEWRLRGDRRGIEARLQQAIRDTDGIRGEQIQARATNRDGISRRSSGRARGGLVYVFFENGETLRITQTATALFVNFDRSVVEEYRFGENRIISVGQAEAQRVSGWDRRDYVIETLDRKGMKLTERYQLSADRRALTRRITFRSKRGETATVTQVFDRE